MTLRNIALLAAVFAASLAVAGCAGVGDSQSQLRSAIDAKKPTLDSCYEQALERDEALAGNMTLWVHLAKKGGTVTEIEIAESSVNDPELTQCVETSLVGTQVTPAPKVNLKVQYEIRFTPEV